MPVCSRCHKDWPEQFWVCPEDGTILSVAKMAASGDTLPRPLGLPLDEDLRPGTIIGEYRVEGKLGEGGMATVFSATHPLIGKKVAIKVLSRRLCADVHAVDRFIGEARTVNQIGHPNLVDIFAFGVLPDGRAYLVMEWLQGETLAERMNHQRLTGPLALDLLLQIVDALEAAHDKRVVHRDLKPANIIVLERKDAMRIKLLDFGIAKLADSDASVPKTRSGVAMGTAGYMSPEQARGKNVDHRTDIYALGCVAYEVLLGRIPFVADTAIDILAMHLAAAPPPPRTLWPDVPPALERVLLQMLAKEPDGRPSLLEVRAQLESALRSITPTMGVPAGPLPHSPRRIAGWAATGTAVALVGAAAGGWLWRRPPPAPVDKPALAGPLFIPSLPSASVPPANVPSANVPPANVPSANVPAANAASANGPAVNVPAANVPSANVPAANAASANGPAVNVPAANVPSANVPAANAASANGPAVNVPAANVPSANVSSANVPSANVPSANVPSANVPSASVPKTTPAALPANGPAAAGLATATAGAAAKDAAAGRATLILWAPPGARVQVDDGKPSTAGAEPLAVAVAGGDHTVQVIAGRARFRQRVHVAAGATVDVRAPLPGRPASHHGAGPSEASDKPGESNGDYTLDPFK